MASVKLLSSLLLHLAWLSTIAALLADGAAQSDRLRLVREHHVTAEGLEVHSEAVSSLLTVEDAVYPVEQPHLAPSRFAVAAVRAQHADAVALTQSALLAQSLLNNSYADFTFEVLQAVDYCVLLLAVPTYSNGLTPVAAGFGTVRLLVNGPHNDSFPVLGSSLYSSPAATTQGPFVAIPRPAPGLYRVAVYYAGSDPFINYSISAVAKNATDAVSMSVMANTTASAAMAWFPGTAGAFVSVYLPPAAAGSSYADMGLLFEASAPFEGSTWFAYCSASNPTPNVPQGQFDTMTWMYGDRVPPFAFRYASLPLNDLRPGFYYCSVVAGSGIASLSVSPIVVSAQLYPVQRLQWDTVYDVVSTAGSQRFFSLDIAPGSLLPMTITTVSNYGPAYLYVTTYPSAPPAVMSVSVQSSVVAAAGTQTLLIPNSLCTGRTAAGMCRYQVVVWSPQAASFRLFTAVGNASLPLPIGAPLTASLQAGQFRYYSFMVQDAFSNVTITLSVEYGNADLFVSRTAQFPRRGDARWFSELPGSDVVQFGYTDSDFSSTPITGRYYVSVFGATAAAYSIVVQVRGRNDSISAIALRDSQPEYGAVDARETQHYTFAPSPTSWPYTLTLSLSVIIGDADLVVNADGSIPVIGYASWSTWGSAIKSITIAPTTPSACSPLNSSACHYTIAVVGRAAAARTRYYVTVSSGATPQRLVSGVATGLQSLAVNAWHYYFLPNPSPPRSVVFGVTAVAGNTDLYASNSSMAPSPSNSQWSSLHDGADVIAIQQAQSDAYYVGVLCTATGNLSQWCDYSLLGLVYDPAHPEDSPVTLRDGVPVNQLLPRGEWRYYQFRLDTPASRLSLRLEALYGQPDLYLSSYALNSTARPFPNETHYDLISDKDGDDEITLRPTAAGHYLIGVKANSRMDAAFSLVLTLAGSSQLLQTGQFDLPSRGELETGESNYYYVIPRFGLQLFLQSISGNCDLYASDSTARPGPGQPNVTYNWTSSRSGSDSLAISGISAPVLYLAVYAQSSCSYALTATSRVWIQLQETTRTTTLYICFPSATGFTTAWRFVVPGTEVSGEQQTPFVNLRVNGAISGGAGAYEGNIYVGVNRQPDPADPSSYDYSLITTAGGFANVIVPPQACANRSLCTYYTIVQSTAATQQCTGMRAYTSSNHRWLTPGVPVDETVRNEQDFYVFTLPSDRMNVTLTLTTKENDANIVCSAFCVPPMTSVSGCRVWTSSFDRYSGLNDTIAFDWTDARFRSNDLSRAGFRMSTVPYFCIVESVQGVNSSYSLLLSTINQNAAVATVPLIDGAVALLRLLPPSTYAQFSYAPSALGYPYDVTVSVTATSGDVNLYVRSDGEPPAVSFYTWRSEAVGVGVETVTVRSDDALACSNASVRSGQCVYTIAVYGVLSSRFSISVFSSSPTAGTLLIPFGVIQAGVVSRAGPSPAWMFYGVEVDAGVVVPELTVTVTSYAGDPLTLYSHNSKPNQTTASSFNSLGTDIVSIPRASPGVHFIGVTGSGFYLNIPYAVVATNGVIPISLQLGRLQEDTLSPAASRLYSVYFSDPATRGSKDLTIEVVDLTAAGDLFVYVRADGALPSATSYTWMSSSRSVSGNTIVVSRSDPNRVQDGLYRILVVNAHSVQNASYSITAGDGAATSILKVGRVQSMQGSAAVAAGESRYYLGYAAVSSPTTLTVTCLQGAVTAFVSRDNARPSLANHTFRGNASAVHGRLSLSIELPTLTPEYYVGIHSEPGVDSRYSVSWAVSAVNLLVSPVLLAFGSHFSGACRTQPRYYQINVPRSAQARSVTFTIRAADPASESYSSRVQLHLHPTLRFPDNRTAMWSAPDSFGFNKQFTISSADANLVSCLANRTDGCSLFMALSCTAAATQTSFLLSPSLGPPSALLLVDGKAQAGAIKKGESQFFTSYTPASSSLWLQLETCSGNADLFVSGSSRTPAAADSQYRSVKKNALDTVIIPASSANSIWYSAAAAPAGSSEYRLHARTLSASQSFKSVLPVIDVLDLQISRAGDDGIVLTGTGDGNADSSASGASATARAGDVIVRFARARLPSAYSRPPAGLRYTLRYALYLSDRYSKYTMHSECGLLRATEVSTLMDDEIDEAAVSWSDDGYGSITLRIPAAEIAAASGDEDEVEYRVNVIVHILSKRSGSGWASTQWSVYDAEEEVRLSQLPTVYGGNTGPKAERSVGVLAAIIAGCCLLAAAVCCLVALVARRHCVKRRNLLSQPTLQTLEMPLVTNDIAPMVAANAPTSLNS